MNPVNLKLTVEAWMDIVIKIWIDKIRQHNIIDTGELLASFVSTVYLNSGGDPERIVFAFKYYGRFSDMGVGRGVPISEVPLSKRRPKPWFSAMFDHQVEQLAGILEEKYGMKIAYSITDTLNEA